MTDTNTATVPVHKRPTSCYVCGAAPRDGESRPPCHHNFTNAEARAEAAQMDRFHRVLYPNGQRTPEGAYVEDHRPY